MLEQMSRRLHVQPSFERAVAVILDDAIALLGAEFGNLQLLAGDHLVIADQRGFKALFLDTFRRVRADDGCACGRALKTGHTIVVADIEVDEQFAPYREVARAAGFRSVATTPLRTRDNILIGAVSTHFVNVHRPTPIEIETLQDYGAIAAEFLHRCLDGGSLDIVAGSLSSRSYPLDAPAPTASPVPRLGGAN